VDELNQSASRSPEKRVVANSAPATGAVHPSQEEQEELIWAWRKATSAARKKLLGASPDDCLDVAGDTIVTVIEQARLGGYDPSRGRLSTWASKIAVNRVLKERRKRRMTRVALELCEIPEREASVPRWDEAELQLLRISVRAAIETLPNRQRKVIRLRYDSGLSFHEIAQELMITESYARLLALRARNRLRTLLEHALDQRG
jgi:RNA polymerase sigma-70 factor, ECF subfamily